MTITIGTNFNIGKIKKDEAEMLQMLSEQAERGQAEVTIWESAMNEYSIGVRFAPGSSRAGEETIIANTSLPFAIGEACGFISRRTA